MIGVKVMASRCYKGVLILLALMAMTACSTDPREAIVGEWREIDGTEEVEFLSEGTVIFSDQGLTFSGDYEFIEKDRIKLRLGGIAWLAGAIVAEVSISGNVLTLTANNEKPEKYRRVR
ncbi:hypothetical protein [Marinobacter sp. M5B]|uniref:hypothetical protein n=1 Tax=Marinobacter sp. M5B TaxID=3141535 RepID=UPI0036D3FDA4